MIFSYQQLKKYYPKIPQPEKLAKLLDAHSFETSLKKENDDILLEVDILPNRYVDCANYLGLIREIRALNQEKFDDFFSKPDFLLKEKVKRTKFRVKIENNNDCPFYSAAIIKGIKIKESPDWLKKLLLLHNISPHNIIVDLTNYLLLETGQPTHCFDLDKIEGQEINIRRAKKGEKIITLDNQKVSLDKEILVIADKKEPLAIAGIKGGKKAEVDWTTKNIILESASFSQSLIYQTSKKLNLSTDASSTFSYDLPPELAKKSLFRLINLIQKYSQGKLIGTIFQGKIEKRRKIIYFDLKQFTEITGEEINFSEVKKILSSLGIKFLYPKKIKNEKIYLFEVPFFRKDINLPQDLYEEVIRIIGYDKIKEEFPLSSLQPARKNEENEFEKAVKRDLVSFGFDEVYNYSLVSQKDLKNFNLEKDALPLLNPTSQEFKFLRPLLSINLLKTASLNLKFFEEVRIFEIGKVFFEEKNNIKEKKNLALLLAQKNSKEEIFFLLKGIIEKILEGLNLAKEDYSFKEIKETKNSPLSGIFFPKKSALIESSGKIIGSFGQVKPSILKEFSCKPTNLKLILAEFDLPILFSLTKEERDFQPISPFPAVIKDISLVVNQEVKVDEILEVISQLKIPILLDVDMFDFYQGEELGPNKKSLSFHLIFQSDKRSLREEEVKKEIEKIVRALEKKLKAKLRS